MGEGQELVVVTLFQVVVDHLILLIVLVALVLLVKESHRLIT